MKDPMLRAAIIGEVRSAMREYLESVEEVYVSQKELSSRISFFTPEWLKRYGHLLPRESVTILKDDGSHTNRRPRYGYPLHKINRMIADGSFRRLEYKAKDINHQN